MALPHHTVSHFLIMNGKKYRFCGKRAVRGERYGRAEEFLRCGALRLSGAGEEGPDALHQGLVFRAGGELLGADEFRRGGLGVLEGLEVQLQASHLEGGQAVLPGAEEVAGTPEGQVLPGDFKAVVGLAQGLQPLQGLRISEKSSDSCKYRLIQTNKKRSSFATPNKLHKSLSYVEENRSNSSTISLQ